MSLTICERCGKSTKNDYNVPVRRQVDSLIIVYAMVCKPCYEACLALVAGGKEPGFYFLEELVG